MEKSAIPFKRTPPAPEDRGWDASAAEARVRAWAGGDDAVDWDKYRQAFAWYNAENAKEFGAYALPHHDVVDGKLVVVWRGVAAAMAALLGARGGVKIPDADKDAIYAHLRQHYDQFDKEPPEMKEAVAKAITPAVSFIAKNEEKRLVYGIVYEPEKVDAQGDFATADEIERAAHGFMQKLMTQGHNRIKEQHQNVIAAMPVENYVAPADFYINGEFVRKGSWVLVTKVLDDTVWAKVKSGEIGGYSLGGRARGVPAGIGA